MELHLEYGAENRQMFSLVKFSKVYEVELHSDSIKDVGRKDLGLIANGNLTQKIL